MKNHFQKKSTNGLRSRDFQYGDVSRLKLLALLISRVSCAFLPTSHPRFLSLKTFSFSFSTFCILDGPFLVPSLRCLFLHSQAPEHVCTSFLFLKDSCEFSCHFLTSQARKLAEIVLTFSQWQSSIQRRGGVFTVALVLLGKAEEIQN